MSQEKVREEFEAWFADHSKDWPFPSDAIKSIAKQNDWLVWQASRAVVVIELPMLKPNPNLSAAEAGFNEALLACMGQIEAEGLGWQS